MRQLKKTAKSLSSALQKREGALGCPIARCLGEHTGKGLNAQLQNRNKFRI